MANALWGQQVTDENSKGQERTGILELFGKERLEEIQEKIGRATGLAFVTVDYKGEPITETTCFTEYCRAVREDASACELCKKSDAFGALQAAISRKPCIYYCPCGMLEVAIPIEDKGAFLGGFIGGQIRCEDAPMDVPRLAGLFKQDEDMLNREDMIRLKGLTREYSYTQFNDIVNLIHMIINQLTENESDHVADTQEIKDALEKIAEDKRKLKYRMEVFEQKMANIMMNQNQYFIANTLSSISSLSILENAEGTNEMLLLFAEYMKNSNRSPEDFWTLGEEAEQIERYVKLACAKYGDRFQYQIRIMEKMKNKRVPVYLLLPYIENAIYYGVALSKEDGVLKVTSSMEDGVGIVEIIENGPGYTDEELQEKFQEYKGNHEGKYIDRAIYQSRKRLISSFGEEYEPEILVESGVGRRFRIKIPAVIAGGMEND